MTNGRSPSPPNICACHRMTFANDADEDAAICSCAPGSSVLDACTGTDFQGCAASCEVRLNEERSDELATKH